MYYAAGRGLARFAKENPVWAFHLEQAPEGVEEFMLDLDALEEAMASGIADSDEFHGEMNEVAEEISEDDYRAATWDLVELQRGLVLRALGLPNGLGASQAFAADAGKGGALDDAR